MNEPCLTAYISECLDLSVNIKVVTDDLLLGRLEKRLILDVLEVPENEVCIYTGTRDKYEVDFGYILYTKKFTDGDDLLKYTKVIVIKFVELGIKVVFD